MTPSEALEYLTTHIALNYKPRRMPWEHDQDTPAVRQATLRTWVDLLTEYPTATVHQAFDDLMRHQPTQPPTRAEAANQLRNTHQRTQPETRQIGSTRRTPPEQAYLIAHEAYEAECRRQGKQPNQTLFDRYMGKLVK